MIIKITPDKEKAKSMFELIKDREKFVCSSNVNEISSTIIAENYYEIIKELVSVIALLDGFKATGENAHKELIEYISNYKELSEDEVFLMNDLRIKRNKSCYEGKKIEKDYLENKKVKLLSIIQKLKALVTKKLK
jgi:hypothetical protein